MCFLFFFSVPILLVIDFFALPYATYWYKLSKTFNVQALKQNKLKLTLMSTEKLILENYSFQTEKNRLSREISDN